MNLKVMQEWADLIQQQEFLVLLNQIETGLLIYIALILTYLTIRGE